MAKVPTKNGTEFQRRTGADPFGAAGWRGVNTEADPASIAINQLQWGVDIRIRGGQIMTRPGLSKKVDLKTAGPPLSGDPYVPIMWMNEAPVDNPSTRVWMTTIGCLGGGVQSGATVLHYDRTDFPKIQTFGQFFSAADRFACLGVYAGDLYLGNGSALTKIDAAIAPTGIPIEDIGPTPNASPFKIFDGYAIRFIMEQSGLMIVGLENLATPAASKIVAWNGLSWTDELTGIRPPQSAGFWQNKLVVGFDSTAAHIRVRSDGATSPGTWTTVALAGFSCSQYKNAIVEERQYTYIAGGQDKIFRFDGTNLVLIQTIAGCAVDGKGVTSLTMHEGLLHYGWNTPAGAPGYSATIGRHDPDSTFSAATEWIDSYKLLTASQPNFVELTSMLSHRGQIFCGGRQVWIVATAQNDVKGTVEVVNNTGALSGVGFDVLQMLRYPAVGA